MVKPHALAAPRPPHVSLGSDHVTLSRFPPRSCMIPPRHHSFIATTRKLSTCILTIPTTSLPKPKSPNFGTPTLHHVLLRHISRANRHHLSTHCRLVRLYRPYMISLTFCSDEMASIKTGCCTADCLINILLCMLGYIPGLLHAWYIIAKFPEHDYDRVDDVERQGRVTYYYVSHQPGQNQRSAGQRNYGTQSGARAPAVPANKPQPQQQSGTARIADVPDATGPSSSSVGAGSSERGAPPSYSDVVRGDNKIQSQD